MKMKLFQGYVDCPLTKLQDLPVSSSTHYHDVINQAADAIGQIVVVSNCGARFEANYLTIPALRLRHRDFLHQMPLWHGTCSDLGRFYDQHTITSPTATLIEPDKILTAYHAIIPKAIRDGNTYFVYDRWVDRGIDRPRLGRHRIHVPAERAVKVVDICKMGKGGTESGNDWAILQLERSIQGVTPIALDCEGLPVDPVDPNRLFILSHPLGLPLKHAAAERWDSRNAGPSHILSDIGSGSSGAPVLFIAEGAKTATVVGVVNGGPLGFDWRHFVRTPTGVCIDPGPVGELRPQPVTSADRICLADTETSSDAESHRSMTTAVSYEIKFQDTSEPVWCDSESEVEVRLVQTDIAEFPPSGGTPEYVDEIIVYYSGTASGEFTLNLTKLDTESYEVSEPDRMVLAGASSHGARASSPSLSHDETTWTVTFTWPASLASVSTVVFTFGTGGPPTKLKVVVKKQEFTCPANR
jgi:hypothetical protein